jgi:integrase/recombinase XerD
MPTKLSTTVAKIATVPNRTNAELIKEFYGYMRERGSSEAHQNNNLKVAIAFAKHLGAQLTFYQLEKREQILQYLNTKVKAPEQDPEKKWITTWNDNLRRIKLFLRWLYNKDGQTSVDDDPKTDWETPPFARIKEKRSKRLSPYSETEIWDRDEILTIVKYEPHKRNKAALTLLWDLDARNHEVTLLRIKNIRLRERYGEGEVPHEAKTGAGPVLLTCSFPYMRDWLNEHPVRNNSNAPIICNVYNGRSIGPDRIWRMMNELKERIIRLLEAGSIEDPEERQKLEYLLKTKKWNPYCIRHSAITADSDFLPEYALKKKVRWSMNSKQGARYIKRRLSNDLKMQILARNGIIPEDGILKPKASVLSCPRCQLVNTIENRVCTRCSYPLVPEAYEEIKADEAAKVKRLEEKYEQTNSLLVTLIGTMSTADDETKKKVARQWIESGLHKPLS